MGKVKDSRQIQIEKAAGNFLSEEPDNLFFAYLTLLQESEKGNDDCLAADYVLVWQPLENLTVAKMIETIENAVVTEVPEIIEKINWEDLKGQKLILLKLIDEIEKQKSPDAIISIPVEAADALNGILNLIDSIQDYAVDVIGIDENKVFDLHPEE